MRSHVDHVGASCACDDVLSCSGSLHDTLSIQESGDLFRFAHRTWQSAAVAVGNDKCASGRRSDRSTTERERARGWAVHDFKTLDQVAFAIMQCGERNPVEHAMRYHDESLGA